MLRASRLTSSDQQNNPSCVNAARRDPKHSIENHQDILRKPVRKRLMEQRLLGEHLDSLLWFGGYLWRMARYVLLTVVHTVSSARPKRKEKLGMGTLPTSTSSRRRFRV